MTWEELRSEFRSEDEWANCMIDVQNNGTPTDIAVKYGLRAEIVAVVFRVILKYKASKLLGDGM